MTWQDSTFEELIAYINEAGWLLHSMSQYRSAGRPLLWSCTLRFDGPDRQPISRGQDVSMYHAVLIAYGGTPDAKLEPETTVHAAVKEPRLALANLLPTRPALVIRRR